MAAGRQGLAGNGRASQTGKGIDHRYRVPGATPFFVQELVKQ